MSSEQHNDKRVATAMSMEVYERPIILAFSWSVGKGDSSGRKFDLEISPTGTLLVRFENTHVTFGFKAESYVEAAYKELVKMETQKLTVSVDPFVP